jgi:hypothetical protein
MDDRYFNSYDNCAGKSPLNSNLFTNGFENDDTPLDEYNLNTLIDAIHFVKGNIDTDVSGIIDRVNSELSDINNRLNSLDDTEVVVERPTLTVTLSGAGSYESGTTVTPSYAVSFNSGRYKYGPTPTGVELDNYKVTFNGQELSSSSGTFSPVTVGTSTSLSIQAEGKYKNTTNKVPVSSMGKPLTAKKLTSGDLTIVYSGTQTVSGYRMGCFYGTVSTSDMSADKITSSMIRGLNKSNKSYARGNLTLNVPVGATAILIACPSNKPGPTYTLNTTVNAPMTDLFGSGKIVKTLKVPGAGTDEGENYNVWMFTPAEPYGSVASLTITLG